MDEKFLRCQLRRPIQIDGVYRFVSAQRHHFLNAGIERCFDDVSPTDDVGHNGFDGVVFAGRYLLESGGMDDDIYTLHRPSQAHQIPHISDKVTQASVVKPSSSHLMLLEFIPAKNDQLRRLSFIKHDLHKLPAK